jgi:hypothetical protein
MITKKDYKAYSEEVKLVSDTFISQKWIRYQEFNYSKNGFHKKILFKFPNKVSNEILLTKKDYLNWRKILEDLYKTNKKNEN